VAPLPEGCLPFRGRHILVAGQAPPIRLNELAPKVIFEGLFARANFSCGLPGRPRRLRFVHVHHFIGHKVIASAAPH
jgi:hypothetical protein